jgi:hypothetical protein
MNINTMIGLIFSASGTADDIAFQAFSLSS